MKLLNLCFGLSSA
ncbi:hypothetical protein Kpol_1073p5, partial [Vanderwaltozyma polyspora DSM 70294]